MRSRLLLVVGLALGAVLHVAVTDQVVAPGLAVAVALGALGAGPRWQLVQAAEALLVVALAGLVFGVAAVDPPLDWQAGGIKLQYAIFSGTALLAVAARLWLEEPERGDPATWVLGLVVFTCCGRVASPLFLPLVVGYLGLAWLHRVWRPERVGPLGRRHLVGAVALIVATALTASTTTAGLRQAYAAIEGVVFVGGDGGTVGFGAGAFRLGSMDGLRDDDTVLLRVHGSTDPHLRGQAYADYGRGFWVPPEGEVTPVPLGEAPGPDAVVIDFVQPDQDRLFLPPGVGAVATEPAGVVVDALGIPQPDDGSGLVRVRAAAAGAERFPSPPPSAADLVVPDDVAAALGGLVAQWTAGATSDAQRLARLQTRLEEDYTYSLAYERDAERDPVVQFLLESRLGHCEYFASGLALTARIAGIPARVVTGYRGTELSPFGGHRIVRGRDAHAWVEAWVDGAWVTADPSPQNAVNASFLRSAADDLAVWWERYGLQSLAGVLLVVFVGLQIRTLLRDRTPVEEAVEAWVEGPPDYLLGLLEGLGEADLVRRPEEAVEVFADRVEEAGRADAGALLRRYAAQRYGGIGAASELARDVGAWTEG